MAKKFGTIKDLTKYVMFSIAVVIIYTVAEFVTSTITGVHHDVLTGCVYGFFAGEVTLCCILKIFKIKREGVI